MGYIGHTKIWERLFVITFLMTSYGNNQYPLIIIYGVVPLSIASSELSRGD